MVGQFKEDRIFVEDNGCSGLPSSGRNNEKIACICDKILENHRKNISDSKKL